jgi:hypothetical protein
MRRCLFILAALLLWNCAASNGNQKPRSLRYVITEEEIVNSGATNVLDAIQQLKPEWLLQGQRRGVKSVNVSDSSEPVVYVNNARYGGVESLVNISTLNVLEIRFLQPSEATTRFGTGHAGGAFLVKVK